MTRLAIVIAAAFAFGLASSAAVSKMSEPTSQVIAAPSATSQLPSARYVSVGWFTRRVVAR